MTTARVSTRSANPTAALWLATFALFTLTAMNAFLHEAAKVAPVGQLVFWRSFVALGPIRIYLICRRELGTALRTDYPHKHLIRGILGSGVMMFNFIALAFLVLLDASSVAGALVVVAAEALVAYGQGRFSRQPASAVPTER